MSKRKSRKPFETASKPKLQAQEKLIDTTSGVFSFFKDYGTRETIESVIVAVVLALMFRAYEAEAFIIPTGSMAPTLQGQHMDVVCEECGYQYRAGASASASTTPPSDRADVTKTYCPICRHGMTMKNSEPDHVSNNGDRILVNKFVYDFQPPERFDVIVFKNPNNGKQNYIKRLIGLPGDQLAIENGDIYNFVTGPNGTLQKEIVRKPVDKVPVMLQLIDDTNHVSAKFKQAGWPSRWAEWTDPGKHWREQGSAGDTYFLNAGDSESFDWLRYRHLVPRSLFDESVLSQRQNFRPVDTSATDWEELENGKVPRRIKPDENNVAAGSLIRDYYEYNDRIYRFKRRSKNPIQAAEYYPEFLSQAAHWVGDLGVEFEIEIKSESGKVGFDLVEGGVHFKCVVDIATGEATLSSDGGSNIAFDTETGNGPTAATPLKGSGSYSVRYVHMDDMLYLWINNRYVDFQGSSYVNKSGKRPVPTYSKNDPGDAEPIGIGAMAAAVRVSRIRVYRDVYYVTPVARNGGYLIRNWLANGNFMYVDNGVNIPYANLINVFESPEIWGSAQAKQIFDQPPAEEPSFKLQAGQYFPMGDNSPASQDARIWDGPKFVNEELLIGRAMFVYWPHSLNSPIKYFPNFKRMGFIR